MQKIKSLDSIESFHYHNWVDNRGEGGLRIGLRKFSDEAGDPSGKKPIWDIYRAAGTADEEKAMESAREVVGVKDWGDVRFKGEVAPAARP